MLVQRILGTVITGLIWGAAWALAGVLLKIADPHRSVDELWLGPEIGIYPGFIAGVLFSAALWVAGGRRRLDEMPIPKVIAGGAMAGLFVGALPFVINQPAGNAPLWLVCAVVIGSMTLLGALSAAGSLALARTAARARRS